MSNVTVQNNRENSTNVAKSKTSVRKYLSDQLAKKYSAQFISRKIQEENKAQELSDYMLGTAESHNTRYNDKEITNFLDKQDQIGLKIMSGVGILQSQTFYNNSSFTQHNQQNNLFANQDQGLFANHVEDIMGTDYDNQVSNGEDNIDNTPCNTDNNSNT